MSHSARNNVTLPSEIMEAILCFLPVKSLGRFKLVSKTWCSLISDSQFIKNHLHQNQKARKLILTSSTGSPYSFDLSDILVSLNSYDIFATRKRVIFPTVWNDIMGSCNGLVLAEARNENKTLCLINPATKEIWKVPPSPLTPRKRYGTYLRYQDYGFGYDSSTDDYKIVSLSHMGCDASVYSLRNNSWRRVSSNAPYLASRDPFVDGVLVNQNIHWLAKRRSSSSLNIVAFSLANEEFIEIELSDSIENDTPMLCDLLVDVDGKLGYFSYWGNSFWVMEEYGVSESWTKVCVAGLEIKASKCVRFVEGINRDIVLCDEYGVYVYNMDKRRRRRARFEWGSRDIVRGCVYFDSLESPSRCIRRGKKRY